ncbi:GtrA family protein [Neorhizobium galegae]|uniref:GtrA family protein n=1 Tax=Neorhizobium galegae TaxID=399 RepID=UPI0009B9917D|nr:GtrA family protein [Neorhizobium galegae]
MKIWLLALGWEEWLVERHTNFRANPPVTTLVEIKRLYAPFIRYAFVGILMNSLGYFLYFCATQLRIEPKTAMTLIYVVGVGLNFILSRRWVFGHKGKWGATFGGYVLVYLLGYIMNYSILWFLVDRIGWGHLFVQALSIVVVAVFLFVSLRFFVFRHRDGARVQQR